MSQSVQATNSPTTHGVTATAGNIIGGASSITSVSAGQAIVVSAQATTHNLGDLSTATSNILHSLAPRYTVVNGANANDAPRIEDAIVTYHRKTLFGNVGYGSAAVAAGDGSPAVGAIAPEAQGSTAYSRIETYAPLPAGPLARTQETLKAHKIDFDEGFIYLEPMCYAGGVLLGISAISGFQFTQSQVLQIAGVAMEKRVVINPTRGTVQMNPRDCNVLTTTSLHSNHGNGVREWLHVLAVIMGANASDDSSMINNANQQITLGGTADYTALIDTVNYLMAVGMSIGRAASYAYALDVGIQSVITVVGETDEGAWMRDMTRCSRYGVPFGVCIALDSPGVAVLSHSIKGNRSCIYERALVVPAAWSVADPTVSINGTVVPTLIAGGNGAMKYGVDTSINTMLEAAGDDPLWFTMSMIKSAVKRFVDMPAKPKFVALLASTTVQIVNLISSFFVLSIGQVPQLHAQNVTTIDREEMDALFLYISDTMALTHSELNRVLAALANNDIINGNEFGVTYQRAVAAVAPQGQNVGAPAVPYALVNDIALCADVRSYERSELITLIDKSLNQPNSAGGIDYFVKAYTAAHGLSSGDETVKETIRLQQVIFNKRLVNNGEYCRHLNNKYIQLYSWIEANGLIPLNCGVPAITHFNASFTDIGTSTDYDAFNGEYRKANIGSNVFMSVRGSHMLRTVHLFNHYRNHHHNGIGGIGLTTYGTGNIMAVVDDRADKASLSRPISVASLTWSLAGQVYPFCSEGLIIADGAEYTYRTTKPNLNAAATGRDPLMVCEQPNHMYNPQQYNNVIPKIRYTMGKFMVVNTLRSININAKLASKRHISKKSTARIRNLHYYIMDHNLGAHSSKFGDYAYTHATITSTADDGAGIGGVGAGAFDVITPSGRGDTIAPRVATMAGLKVSGFTITEGKDKNKTTPGSNNPNTTTVHTRIINQQAETSNNVKKQSLKKQDPAGKNITKQMTHFAGDNAKPQFVGALVNMQGEGDVLISHYDGVTRQNEKSTIRVGVDNKMYEIISVDKVNPLYDDFTTLSTTGTLSLQPMTTSTTTTPQPAAGVADVGADHEYETEDNVETQGNGFGGAE